MEAVRPASGTLNALESDEGCIFLSEIRWKGGSEVADIKTRDVIRGSIKTLDRAASSMHHLKEETIRSKAADIRSRIDGDNAGSYAEDHVEQYAGDSTAYAARSGVEMLLRSRNHNAGEVIESEGAAAGNSLKPPITANDAIGGAEQVSRAYKEQGVKEILGRRSKSRMATEESLRNSEEINFSSRSRSASSGGRASSTRKAAAEISGKRKKASSNAKAIRDARKRHAINRILNKNKAQNPSIITLFRSRNSAGRRASSASRFLRFVWENARTAIAALAAGGAAAVIILIFLVFFGIGVITFSNNSPDGTVDPETGEYEYFIPDLAGSPTRQAIVKAAAKEVGNVGGEKFWRWYGFNYHVHWCACFTSFIAAECGCIQSGICPRSALVDDWISFYKKQHRWAGRNYKPHSGDFILFDWEGDGAPDHIGIVESCDGKTVYTIEGNSRDICRRKSYPVGSGLIYGYGCPNYSGKDTKAPEKKNQR